jgi:hypothetical protein
MDDLGIPILGNLYLLNCWNLGSSCMNRVYPLISKMAGKCPPFVDICPIKASIIGEFHPMSRPRLVGGLEHEFY